MTMELLGRATTAIPALKLRGVLSNGKHKPALST